MIHQLSESCQRGECVRCTFTTELLDTDLGCLCGACVDELNTREASPLDMQVIEPHLVHSTNKPAALDVLHYRGHAC